MPRHQQCTRKSVGFNLVDPRLKHNFFDSLIGNASMADAFMTSKYVSDFMCNRKPGSWLFWAVVKVIRRVERAFPQFQQLRMRIKLRFFIRQFLFWDT